MALIMKTTVHTFFFVLLSFATAAQVDSTILSQRWQAFWITVPDEPEDGYGVYNFRKTFSLEEQPASFVIHVSADNRYKLFVNGKIASLGPARGDLFHWNFETVDIAPFLHQGANVVTAIVWNFGAQRPLAQISWRTAFILNGNSDKESVINTNKTWKCIRDQSYQPLEPRLLYTYYVSGPGERVDYNKRDDRWIAADFDDASWKNASELFNGLPKGVFWWSDGWMLVPGKLPKMELTPQRLSTLRKSEGVTIPKNFPAEKTPVMVKANSKVTMLLDQGFLTNAYPVLQFSKGRDATITLSYAEALYIPENTSDWRTHHKKGNRNDIEGKRFVGVRDQIISNGGGVQTFTPLWWRTYRYLQVEVETKNEALMIDDLYGIFTGYPFELNAEFKTAQPELGKILEVGWRTARLCAMETYMDCPYYEQLQYIGDTRIQALVSLYNSGDDRLVRNAIEQLDRSRMAEGITLSRYPSASPQQIPPFSLWWIGMLHDYWMYMPDSDFVKQKLPGVRQVLNFFERFQEPDGAVKNLPYWGFTDWATGPGWDRGVPPIGSDGSSSAIDLQLCIAYQVAAMLEENEGMEEYAKLYHEKAELLKKTIKARYWDDNRKLFADTKEKNSFSQHSNCLAILGEAVTGQEAKALLNKILNEREMTQGTIYFKYYLHRALVKTGEGNRYLDLLGDWKDQLNNGLTTWAEISDHNNARSDCHAWGSSPNIEFFRIILGIDSDAPGFRKVKIEPHLGNLPEASGKMPHPAGAISVRYYQEKSQWKALVNLPKDITGRFVWKGKEYALAGGENRLSL
jgi:alpha-L-rhamnosidase